MGLRWCPCSPAAELLWLTCVLRGAAVLPTASCACDLVRKEVFVDVIEMEARIRTCSPWSNRTMSLEEEGREERTTGKQQLQRCV